MSVLAPIRVLVVDDNTLFRKGLAGLLALEPDFEVVGDARNGMEAVERAHEFMPDIILMEVYMSGMNGLEVTRRIKETLPHIKIVLLTVSEEDQAFFEAIRSGAHGYLSKKIEPRALFNTLRGIAQGVAPISRVMAGKLLGEFARLAQRVPTPPSRGTTLSPREKEVMKLITKGKTNKEIAKALALAENTVKGYLKNILEKLQLENRVQAAAYAVREGLVGKPEEKAG